MSTKSTQFCLSHAKDAVFRPMKGLRDWLETRDLGLVEATNGQYAAWISRAKDLGGGTGRHFHNYDFQIMYVLKGWLKMYHEGEGEVLMEAGDFVYHPQGHVHDILDYSEDLELFEACSPSGRHSVDV